jgi:hypothetical protein
MSITPLLQVEESLHAWNGLPHPLPSYRPPLRREPTREEIAAVVEELQTQPQVPCPVTHRFAPGVYLREIFMPAGTIVIGAEHRTEHFNVVLTGRARLQVAGQWEEIAAPCTFVSKPGVQKTLRILEDMRWQTIHPTTKTDPEELEAELIVVTDQYRRAKVLQGSTLNAQRSTLNAQPSTLPPP